MTASRNLGKVEPSVFPLGLGCMGMSQKGFVPPNWRLPGFLQEHTTSFRLSEPELALNEALGSLDVTLSPGDIERVEAAVAASRAAGTRYAEPQMSHLDSER